MQVNQMLKIIVQRRLVFTFFGNNYNTRKQVYIDDIFIILQHMNKFGIITTETIAYSAHS